MLEAGDQLPYNIVRSRYVIEWHYGADNTKKKYPKENILPLKNYNFQMYINIVAL